METKLKDQAGRITNLKTDKEFINNILIKNFEFQNTIEYSKTFLEYIKDYFDLTDIQIISIQELQEDKELSFLFKELLDEAIAHFLANPRGKISALYKMLDMGLSTEPDYAHRLYVFLTKEKIEDKTAKSLIYVRIPYSFTKDDLDTLNICIQLFKMFSETK